MASTGSDEGQEADDDLLEFELLCDDNPTGGMRLLSCSFMSLNRKGDTAAGG